MDKALAHIDTATVDHDESRRSGPAAWLAACVRIARSRLARPVLLQPRLLRDVAADGHMTGEVAPLDRRDDPCSDALAGRGLSAADVIRFMRPGA
jgi:hypothetical protein